ncbi:sulfotransferase [Frateuria edaphi]|uniref:sulfotransferase family protein n=1 Tax=Frateuria edaphi TaxID=2898793 RepID=UPI001E58BF4D|nr:sulfotransferase [Frateuria edaphi]UGB45000.1 sulfotransferase [Frateuria edaphi]
MHVDHKTTRPETAVRPIFIIGAPRSATSAMVWALGQHPNIQPMPETAWIASMGVGGYLSYCKGSERGRFSHLSNVEYPMEPFLEKLGRYVDDVVNDVFDVRCRRFYGDFREKGKLRSSPNSPNPELQLLRSPDDPKQRWIDGTPLNSQYIWILSQMFPGARFIHNLRRPDEVITSLEGFATVGANPQPLRDGVATWFQHTENAWYAEQAYGAGKVFRADFHRVGEDPEDLVRDILAFLGEEYSADCLLPLQRRLNSSEVDDQREANRHKLLKIKDYEKAETLFRHIASSGVPDQPDGAAEQVLKQRFLDYCHDRELI